MSVPIYTLFDSCHFIIITLEPPSLSSQVTFKKVKRYTHFSKGYLTTPFTDNFILYGKLIVVYQYVHSIYFVTLYMISTFLLLSVSKTEPRKCQSISSGFMV